MGRLDDKVAIITGGASGIGARTVRLFHEEGARVVIADLQDDKGKALAEELGPNTRYQHTDVAREEEVKELIGTAMREFGQLDCLFNNAGIGGAAGPIAEIPAEGFDMTMAVLLRSVFLGMKFVAPIMTAQGSGSIISTASVAGVHAGLGPHIYSAAKAAVIHLTRSVGMELGEQGVRVNCICPGGIVTPLITEPLGGGEAAERLMTTVLSGFQPLRRAGQPLDIAQAALWLASDESSFVNTQAIIVDGGLTGGRKWSDNQATAERVRAFHEAGGD